MREIIYILPVPLPRRVPEGHAVVVAVDGAVLQSDMVHALEGGGGLCLMRLCVRSHLLQYKILRVSLAATTLSSVICTETHQDAARFRSQAYVVDSARLVGRAFVSVTIVFLGFARVSGLAEVKKKGGAHHSSCPVLFPIFLTALLATCSLTRGKVSVGMFRDRSDPLTDYLRNARRRYARTAERFT